MEQFFLSKENVSKEQVLNYFKEKIKENPKFVSEVDEELIAVTDGYWVYPFLEGQLKNLDYLVLIDGKQTSGVIDCKGNYASRDFLNRKLKTRDFVEKEITLSEYHLLNASILGESEKEFIEYLLDRTTTQICDRHHLVLTTRQNVLDIAPIREFDSYNKRIYLEKVYVLTYYEKGTKKTFKSIYSTILNEFYELDYLKSKSYEEFYKLYKRPIVSLPKNLLNDYYQLAFEVYLKTKEELKFISESDLFHKIRKNIKYKDYTKYNDYLLQLIFYFKRKNYLSELTLPTISLKEEIFFEYLTLKYNPESGMKLAEKVKSGLLKDDRLKFLKYASDLKNSYARKELYLHYSSPRFYNESYMKRYS